MNERRLRYIRGVPILEHLNKLFDQRIIYLERAIEEAKRLMEKTMEGFPAEYAKKIELEQIATLLKEIKDKDTVEIKKMIDAKLSISDYDSKYEMIIKSINRIEKDLSNIQGRILGTGGLAVFIVMIIQILFHVFWSK